MHACSAFRVGGGPKAQRKRKTETANTDANTDETQEAGMPAEEAATVEAEEAGEDEAGEETGYEAPSRANILNPTGRVASGKQRQRRLKGAHEHP